MRYTLRQLEVFLATAHQQNITRAAEQLAMSQSAASSALKELEQQFDQPLFDRIGKRLQLNEQGKHVRPQVESLLAQARELELQLSASTQTGPLKVGATLTIGNYLAVNLMAEYLQQQPGNQASLEVANTATITQKVANFELDIGLVEGELQHPELDVVPWHHDELAVFCAPEHPYAQLQRLGQAELREAQWIVREPGSGTRQTFDRAMHGLLPELTILLELQHTEAIKRAVEAGLGIGCLSRLTLQDALRRGSLVELFVPRRNFQRRFYFILHQKKYRSHGIKQWLALCEKVA